MKNSLSAKRKIRIREYGVWYAMIAIPLIGFLVFSLYPILWAVQKAWFFYDGSISTMRYVGFDNFVTDTAVWTSCNKESRTITCFTFIIIYQRQYILDGVAYNL